MTTGRAQPTLSRNTLSVLSGRMSVRFRHPV